MPSTPWTGQHPALHLFFAFVLLLSFGCGDGNGNNGDGGTDADVNGDADVDADVESDGDVDIAPDADQPGDSGDSAPDADDGGSSELYVDPSSGSDEGQCTEAAPCQTLTHALTQAAAGYTVFLADGTYSAASGEVFELGVPQGVTVEAVSGAQPVLVGEGGGVALRFGGDGALVAVGLRGFTFGVLAEAGSINLDSVAMTELGTGFQLSGNAEVTATDVTFSGVGNAFELADASQVSMTGGSVTGGFAQGASMGTASGSASMVLEEVTMEDNAGPLILVAAASAELLRCTLSNNGPVGGIETHILVTASARLVLNETNILDGSGSAIVARDSSTVTVTGGRIRTQIAATPVRIMLTGGTATFDDVAIEGGGGSGGIEVQGGADLDLSNSEITGFDEGVHIRDGSGTIDNCRITDNEIGVYVDLNDSTLDLRSETQTGSTFRDNTTVGLSVVGTSTRTIQAGGNTWNPSQDGADEHGRMHALTVIAGPHTPGEGNVRIASAGPTVAF